jgi:hypothetical protein
MVIMRIWLDTIRFVQSLLLSQFPSLNGFGVNGNIIIRLTVSLINMGLFEGGKRLINAPQN